MNFFNIQSISSYTKNMEMQLKWQQKKKNNDFTADGSTKLTGLERQAEEMRKAAADGSSKMMNEIRLKLNSGKKLTVEEMDYLQKHDPQTYQHVKAMEAEQESYKRELKKCKTKEEVQRVRMNHTAQSLSAVNNIKNNPAIPEGQKLGLILKELQKHEALQEVTREFVESGKYGKLPTEAERQKAEKDLREAEQAELQGKDPAEKDEKEVAETGADPESARTGTDGEKTAEDTAGIGQRISPEKELSRRRAERTLVDRQEMNRIKAELTPEARKVRRAKAQAAYEGGEPKIQTGVTLNIEVK